MTLPTTGMRWGVSMIASNEAQLGALLGYASAVGATEIAWEPLGAEKTSRRPRLDRGAKAAKRRAVKRRRGQRMSRDAVRAVLDSMPARFDREAIAAAFEERGSSASSAHSALQRWEAAKLVRRVGRGTYQRKTTPAAVAA